MLERVRAVAKGLLGLGVKAGSMVVIYSPTCYEWGVIDFACAAIGAVSVPVYETDSARQAASIIEEVDRSSPLPVISRIHKRLNRFAMSTAACATSSTSRRMVLMPLLILEKVSARTRSIR